MNMYQFENENLAETLQSAIICLSKSQHKLTTVNI